MATSPVRRAVLQLLSAIVIVDALFIAIHYAARMAVAGSSTRAGFTAVWTAVTLAVVLVGLARVRRARGGPR